MRGFFLTLVTLVAAAMIGATLMVGASDLLTNRSSLLAPLVASPRPLTGTPPTGDGTGRGSAGGAAPARPAFGLAAPTTTPVPGEVMLGRWTDEELSAVIRSRIGSQAGGLSLAEPHVRVSRDQIEVTGQLAGLPLPLDILATGRIEVRERRPVIVIDRLEGVGLPLPAPARDRLQELLDRLALLSEQPGVELTRVELAPGLVTLHGRRR